MNAATTATNTESYIGFPIHKACLAVFLVTVCSALWTAIPEGAIFFLTIGSIATSFSFFCVIGTNKKPEEETKYEEKQRETKEKRVAVEKLISDRNERIIGEVLSAPFIIIGDLIKLAFSAALYLFVPVMVVLIALWIFF